MPTQKAATDPSKAPSTPDEPHDDAAAEPEEVDLEGWEKLNQDPKSATKPKKQEPALQGWEKLNKNPKSATKKNQA